MIQPATLIEREAAGDKKIGTYCDCDVLKLQLLLLMWRSGRWSVVVNGAGSGGWSFCRDDTDATLVVVVVVVVVGFEDWWSEVLLEWGSLSAFTRFALITINLKKNYTGHSKRNSISAQILNAALNLHATTHFHCFDILQLKQITFLRILIIFKMKSGFWFWAPHSSTLVVYFTTTLNSHCIFHHNTHFSPYISPQLSLHTEIFHL